MINAQWQLSNAFSVNNPSYCHSKTMRAEDIIGTIGFLLLFFLSPMVLYSWGIHYEDAGGSFVEKIHPATWVFFVAWVMTALMRGNPFLILDDIARHSAFFFYFVGFILLVLFAAFVKKGPFTPLIDTFFMPLVVACYVALASEKQKELWARLFHLAMALNALLGLYEFVTGYRLTPYVAGTVAIESDWRSTAFLGHPLSNATMTGCYILMLACSASSFLSNLSRLLLIGLQALSMVAFGGRAALVLVVLILLSVGSRKIIRLMRGDRFQSLSALLVIMSLPLIILTLTYGLEAGFFDKLLNRFVDDEGSAKARLIMLDLFNSIPLSDLIVGPDGDLLATLQNNNGIEFGIESFWIGFILNYGLIASILFFCALFSFSWKIIRITHSGSMIVTLYFFALASTSVSLSAKDILLGLLVAMLMTLMRPVNNGSFLITK